MNLFADPPPPPPKLPTYNEAAGKILAHLKSTGTKGASTHESAQATGIPDAFAYAILDHLKVDGDVIFGLPVVHGEHGLQHQTETYYFNHTR